MPLEMGGDGPPDEGGGMKFVGKGRVVTNVVPLWFAVVEFVPLPFPLPYGVVAVALPLEAVPLLPSGVASVAV